MSANVALILTVLMLGLLVGGALSVSAAAGTRPPRFTVHCPATTGVRGGRRAGA